MLVLVIGGLAAECEGRRPDGDRHISGSDRGSEGSLIELWLRRGLSQELPYGEGS